MARKTNPLTNTEVKQAKPRDKEYSLMDGDGLKLRVKPNGSKLWLFNYSHPDTKKRTNLGLGRYPEISLADARELRRAAKALLAKGKDPKEDRDQQRVSASTAHANTLKHSAKQWFEIKKTKVTPDYADDIWRSLERHVFPALGKLPVHKIEAPAVIQALKPIASKGSLETVKRVCQRLNEIMTFAVNSGVIKANPLAGIRHAFAPPKKNNMPALKPEELPDLMRALTTARIKLTTRCLIEWELHTMARPSEAAGTCWSEIDFENKLWCIPAHRMKRDRPHNVLLTPEALALLDAMRPISGHLQHVFPSDRNPNRHANNQTANMAIKRMGFQGRLVAHGLRSIASTTLNEQAFDSDLIESALAHIDKDETRSAYNRAEYLQRRRVMMEWWSAHITQAATGNMSLSSNIKTLRVVQL